MSKVDGNANNEAANRENRHNRRRLTNFLEIIEAFLGIQELSEFLRFVCSFSSLLKADVDFSHP